ncbi:MAG TPA: TetR/AcrR family transcriptional regulator [Steroidobacteraceae bacterium]|jgi:AcrR family transcriptional regulator
MSKKTGPKGQRRQRRKDARPSEIVAAAMAVFAERGFGAAKLEEVARRAGVAKGTVFVYFPTKEDLFRAVAQSVLNTHMSRLEAAARGPDRPLSELIPALLGRAAVAAETQLPAVIRLLIAESRTFPDLARVWHDEVIGKVLHLVTSAIKRAQARGEIQSGNPTLYAFSIMGPMLAGVIFREVFRETGAELPDLKRLAAQHAKTIVKGLLRQGD